jgi:hypothetical protein
VGFSPLSPDLRFTLDVAQLNFPGRCVETMRSCTIDGIDEPLVQGHEDVIIDDCKLVECVLLREMDGLITV